MFLNGAAIGMVNITVMRKRILKDLCQALSAWVVAVVGTTKRGTYAYLPVTASRLTPATTVLASVLPAVQNRFVEVKQDSHCKEGVPPALCGQDVRVPSDWKKCCKSPLFFITFAAWLINVCCLILKNRKMKPRLAPWETIKKEYPDRFVLLENPVYDPLPYLKEAIQ